MNRREFLGALSVLTTQRKFYSDAFDPAITTRLPYVQNVRADRGSVMWATQAAGFGSVQYSADGVNFRRAVAQPRVFFPAETALANPFAQYVAQLSRLAPNTTYSYTVDVDGQSIGAPGKFRTAGPGPFRFLVLGDSGFGTATQSRLAARMAAENPALLLHVGDIAYFNGTYDQFQQYYFNYYSDIMARVPFFTAPGNHEYQSAGAAAYFASHTFPTETVPASERGHYYSFDWGNVHFVSLDSNVYSAIDTSLATPSEETASLAKAIAGTGQMLTWLERDLRSTRQFWKVVFFHHPPYAGGPNFGDPTEREVRSRIVPILEAYGVHLVFTGHEHSYQRTFSIKANQIVDDGTGTVYYTTGGGGAEGALLYGVFPIPGIARQASVNHYIRVEPNGTQLAVRAFSDLGLQVDNTVNLAPPPLLSDGSRSIPISFDPVQSSITVRGWNLAAAETFTSDFATALGGTTFKIDGVSVPLVYVSPTQVVGVAPPGMVGKHTFTITTANGTLEFITSV